MNTKLYQQVFLEKREKYLKSIGLTLSSTDKMVSLPRRVSKRIFDIAVSLLVVVFLLPILYLILGIFIKLDSKGSVMFKQKRLGLYEKEFVIYKFRSMADGKVTRVGKFIRKYSLDEFPQFLNVLKGDMAVVGPRPDSLEASGEWLKAINGDEALCKLYKMKFIMFPGITGACQVGGLRKFNVYEKGFSQLLVNSIYIEKMSFGLDLKIILKTLCQITIKPSGI